MPTGLEGAYSGKLVIVGGARCVWDDLAELGPTDADIMCVNDIGIRFPGKIEHWYSNHTDQMQSWLTLRAMGHAGRTFGPKYTHSVEDAPHSDLADAIWRLPVRGNSGLTAVLVGLALGYRKIVVCGVPLDDTGHYCDPPEGHWLQSHAKGFVNTVKWSNFRQEGYDKALLNDAKDHYRGRVRFMSGHSRALLDGA